MDIREIIVNVGSLVGYPFSCFAWMWASYRNQLRKGWYFLGIATGGFISWSLVIGGLLTSTFWQLIFIFSGAIIYIALMITFVLLVEYCQKEIKRIGLERYPRYANPQLTP